MVFRSIDSFGHRMGRAALGVMAATVLCQLAGIELAQNTRQHRETECKDGKNYFIPMARSLWAEGVPRDVWGNFCTHQPPIFPLMLAPWLAAGERAGLKERTTIRVFNIGCAGLVAAGIFLVVHRYIGSPWSLLVALGSGIYPPFIWLCRDAYNEPLFMVFMVWGLGAMFLGLRRGSRLCLAAAALVLALATLTRAVGLPVPIIVGVVAWISSRASLTQVCRLWVPAALVYLAVVGSWSAIISVKAGRVSPVTTSLNWGHIGGLIHLTGDGPISKEARRLYEEDSSLPWRSVGEFHRRMISRHPGEYAAMWVRKAALAWYGTDSNKGQRVLLAMNLPLLLLAAGGVLVWMRSPRPLCVEILSLMWVLLFFWATVTFLAFSLLRYMVPVMWIPMLFGGMLAESAWKRYLDRHRSSAACAPVPAA